MQLNVFSKYSLLFLVLALVFNCKEEKPAKPEDKIVVSFKKEGVLSIKKGDTDSIIKTIDKLETNQGMLFIFPDSQMRSFYMKNTKIPLDILYINESKVIVSVQKNAKPFDETSLPSEAPAKYVLEIYGSLFDEWQLNEGDRIDFEVL